MTLSFHPQTWEDYQFWLANDRAVLRKINQLIRDMVCDPFDGMGKPEPLKRNLSGFWSRRITDKHRIVYLVDDDSLIIAQCRAHHD